MKDDKGRPVYQGREKLKALVFPPGYHPGIRVRRFFHWWSLEKHDDGVPQVGNFLAYGQDRQGALKFWLQNLAPKLGPKKHTSMRRKTAPLSYTQLSLDFRTLKR